MSIRPRTTRFLLACGLAPALFVVVLLVDGATRTGYQPLHHWGSELSLGDRGWLQVTNFIVTGICTMLFAVGLRRVLKPGKGAFAGPALTGIFGFCLVIAGVFATDPVPGYPPGNTVAQHSLPGFIHNANALPTFAALALAPLVLVRRFAGEPGWRGFMWYSLASGLLTLVAFFLAIRAEAIAQQTGTLATSLHGLWQRISIGLGFGWFSVLAVLMLRAVARRPVLNRG
jgi:hypothetical protein